MTLIKIFLLFAIIGVSPVRAAEIKLVGSVYCPLLCEGRDQGFMVDITRAIFEIQGHTVKYKHYPRSRALELVARGEVDGLIGQIAGFDGDYIYPSEQAAVIKLCFYTAKSSSWEYDDVESLKEVKLGLIKDYGYAAVPEVRAHIEQYDKDPQKIGYVVGNKPLLRILGMISLGRFTATIDDANIVNHLVKKNTINDIRVAGCPATRIDSFVIFPRINASSARLARDFDEGMAKLRASGELSKILATYGASDWK